jgi:hypothetical protein
MIGAMTRRALAWLSPLPLVAAGSLAAHGLVYRLAGPGAHDHAQPLAHPPIAWYACAALCGSIALVALAAIAFASVRRGTAARTPYWLIALVPPLGFAAQEPLGGLLHAGPLAVETSFLLGLLLQVPIALLALLVVRLVLATAIGVVRALYSPEPRRVARTTRRRPAWTTLLPSPPALALGYGERGPPALLHP